MAYPTVYVYRFFRAGRRIGSGTVNAPAASSWADAVQSAIASMPAGTDRVDLRQNNGPWRLVWSRGAPTAAPAAPAAPATPAASGTPATSATPSAPLTRAAQIAQARAAVARVRASQGARRQSELSAEELQRRGTHSLGGVANALAKGAPLEAARLMLSVLRPSNLQRRFLASARVSVPGSGLLGGQAPLSPRLATVTLPTATGGVQFSHPLTRAVTLGRAIAPVSLLAPVALLNTVAHAARSIRAPEAAASSFLNTLETLGGIVANAFSPGRLLNRDDIRRDQLRAINAALAAREVLDPSERLRTDPTVQRLASEDAAAKYIYSPEARYLAERSARESKLP